MAWVQRGSILHWQADTFEEPDDGDLLAYRFSAVPVAERQHETCGRPGTGRSAHKRHSELPCQVCLDAEAQASRQRKAARVDDDSLWMEEVPAA